MFVHVSSFWLHILNYTFGLYKYMHMYEYKFIFIGLSPGSFFNLLFVTMVIHLSMETSTFITACLECSACGWILVQTSQKAVGFSFDVLLSVSCLGCLHLSTSAN